MAIVVRCGKCGETYKFHDSAEGKKGKCKKCGSFFPISSNRGSSSGGSSSRAKPAKKKSPAGDDDDFLDALAAADASGEPVDEDQPALPPRQGGGRTAGVNPGSRKPGKGRTSKKGTPKVLLIGGGLVAILLAGGAIFFYQGRKGAGEKGAEVNGPAPGGGNDSPAATRGTVLALPRAMIQVPDWLAKDAPFDVKQFWVTVPAEQNAAPLYLDALYEFSPHLEICFPPDVRAERTPGSKARFERSEKLQIAWYGGQQPKNAAERDAVLDEHVAAFEKLEAAQKRNRCLFEFGIDVASQVPLMHAVREVARVAGLDAERDIAKGDFDHLVRTTGIVLRLSRDLRPRAPAVVQSLSDAIDAVCFASLMIPALKSPALTPAQCDQLLALLVEHDARLQAIDPFLTGARADHLKLRILLHDIQEHTGDFADDRYREAFGTTSETRGEAIAAAVNDVSGAIDAGAAETRSKVKTAFDTFLTAMQPAHFAAEKEWLVRQYRELADSVKEPYAKRVASVTAWQSAVAAMQSAVPPQTPPDQIPTVLGKLIADGTLKGPFLAPLLETGFVMTAGDPPNAVVDADVRGRTRCQGTMALVALRRWYGTKAEPPSDFAAMCRAAGLTEPPRDFFGDGPLKMAVFQADTLIEHPWNKEAKALAGETIVYSVGPDGVDDQAVKDIGNNPTGAGDYLFRLEIPQNRIPVTAAAAAAPLVPRATTAVASKTASSGSKVPHLPDAVTEAPAWLVGTAPFDVAKYFEVPPPDQNAAPLYLDAIFEFASDVEKCFPDGPERARRKQATEDRMKRYMALQDQPRAPANAAQWDALLRDYEPGFQKLALAQKRPKCVVETGVGFTALLPHAQGARHISRIAIERTRRDLESGNFNRPLESVDMCLRLSRDIRPRSFIIGQLVSTAMDSISCDAIVRRILSAPGVKREDCDRLLKMLKVHDDLSQNMLVEGAQGEYVGQRVTLRQLQVPEDRRRLKETFGLKDDSPGAILAAIMAFGDSGAPNAQAIENFNQLVAKINEKLEIADMDDQYRTALKIADMPYPERAPAWTQLETALKEKQPIFSKLGATSWRQAAEAFTRGATKRHGTLALIAVRRWQLTHSEAPRDLAQVMSDAGIKSVPRDDYGEGPFQMTTVNGETVIYSVGPDGKDDGALIDWNYGQQPGDFVFHMAPPP